MIKRTTIEANSPKSLCWTNDELTDWVTGGTTYDKNGKKDNSIYYLANDFDSVKSSKDGTYFIAYQRLGTKGVILKNNKILREINRSFYHANVYEYPLAIITLPNGKEALIHCPNEYWKLEVEDLETGEILTQKDRAFIDIFHSRIESSSKYLLSAGWVWHPLDILCIYKITDILNHSDEITKHDIGPDIGVEISSARFFGGQKVIMSSLKDELFNDDKTVLQPSSIGIYDPENQIIQKQIKVAGEFGNVVGINDDFALDLFDYPKIINLNTGKIEEKIEDIYCGKQNSSIIHHLDNLPQIAIHSDNSKIAITTDIGIEILEIEIGK